MITRKADLLLRPALGWFLLASLLTLVVGALIAWQLGRRFARPLRQAEEATRRIAGGDLSTRLPTGEGGGTSDELEAKGIHNTGSFGQGGPIATAGGLVFIAGTIDKRVRAFESQTGKMLWEAKLDSEAHTSPMTYLGRNGKQYVVVVSSGINAFSLE